MKNALTATLILLAVLLCLPLIPLSEAVIQPHHAAVARIAAGGGLSADPLHWWDLDDDGTWADSAGSWDLTESGTVTVSSAAGPGGQDVASMNANADYLDRTAVTWDGAQDHLTVSAWAKMTSISSTGNWLVSHRGATTSNIIHQMFFRNLATDVMRNNIYDVEADSTTAEAATVPSTGTWYDIVATWDGTTHRIYIDGTEDGTDTPGDVGAFITSAEDFALGTASWAKGGTATAHLGELGMVGIWDEALTADDVAYLYNSGNGRQFSDL